MLSPREFKEDLDQRILNTVLRILATAMSIFLIGSAISLLKFLVKETKNLRFKDFSREFKRGFRNLLGIRKKKNVVTNSPIIQLIKTKTRAGLENQHSFEPSSDSEELSDLEENKVSPICESKSQKKIPPKRNNWGRGNSIYKSHFSHITLPKIVPTNTKMIKATSDKVYELHNIHGKFFGSLSVNPRLIESLDLEQKRVLESLCDTGRIIEGNSKGRKGWIPLPEKKDSDWALKGKDAGHDFRFYATATQKSGQKKTFDYYCTGFRSSHKNQSRITRIK